MKICVQSGGIVEHIGAEKCYDLLEKAGFGGVDWQAVEHACPGSIIRNPENWGTCIYDRPLDEVLEYFKPELELIRSHGLTISQAHAPFPAYLPGQPELLEYMIGIYKRIIELCDHVGCKNLVIHGISLSISDTTDTLESVKALNYHLYESLIPTLQKCNVTVCLENLFTTHGGNMVEGCCSDPYEAVEYIDTLNQKAGKEAFGLCLDTGHLWLLGKDFRKYVPILGKRIKCLHIHDNDGRTDAHLAPMAGKIDWKSFCQAMHDVGYTGNIGFETFKQARAALAVDEELLLPTLTHIRVIGEYFRKQIQG